MKFFDSHAHLDDDKFNQDREELIEQIQKSDISNFVSVGYSLEASVKALELANKYNFIYATVGISPNDIPQSEEQLWKDLDKLEEILRNETSKTKLQGKETSKTELQKKEISKLVAIGEIGLDYYWEKEEKKRELQRKAFIYQIKLANKYNFPIVIHTRDAIMDTLDILKNNEVLKKGIFHCCPQNRELIKEALKLGFYISFAGPVTFKNSKNANEIIEMVPNDKMLIETDSPYLAPEPVRGTRNDPRNVKYVAEKVAMAKNLDIEKVAEITSENAMRIFNIKLNRIKQEK